MMKATLLHEKFYIIITQKHREVVEVADDEAEVDEGDDEVEVDDDHRK
jgi:hypothetical protein